MLKFTLKILLVISLFCSVALAEGDQGSGGFAEGDQGSGGKNCVENCLVDNQKMRVFKDNQTESEDYLLTFIRDFLTRILG